VESCSHGPPAHVHGYDYRYKWARGPCPPAVPGAGHGASPLRARRVELAKAGRWSCGHERMRGLGTMLETSELGASAWRGRGKWQGPSLSLLSA
jgi:hypothetical protein